MKFLFRIPLRIVFFFSCKQNSRQPPPADLKGHRLSLEYKWLPYEFALNTAAVSPLPDATFISLSADDTSNKQMELQGIDKNISAMRSDGIFSTHSRWKNRSPLPFMAAALSSFSFVIRIKTQRRPRGKTDKVLRCLDEQGRRMEGRRVAGNGGGRNRTEVTRQSG